MVTEAERGDDYRPLPGFREWWQKTDWSHEYSTQGFIGKVARAAFTAVVLHAKEQPVKGASDG